MANGTRSMKSKRHDAGRFFKAGDGNFMEGLRKARGRFAEGGMQFSSPRMDRVKRCNCKTLPAEHASSSLL